MSAVAFWILLALSFPIIAVIALVVATGARGRIDELEHKLRRLVDRLDDLEARRSPAPSAAAPAAPPSSVPPPPPPAPDAAPRVVSPPSPPRPAPIFSVPEPILMGDSGAEKEEPLSILSVQPKPSAPSFSFDVDWEKFTAARLFSWAGGVALFLGMGFFVKFAADRGLFPPLVRVVLGLLTGVGCIVGGLSLRRREGVAVTVNTLCAAGVAVLYVTVFAARTLFGLVDPLTAFFFMALVTVLGFTLAVRLDSRYIAILGLVGGFLTPVLVSTGRDNAVGLFSYVALLDLGLAAVVMKRRWDFLWGLAALGTLALGAGWMSKFFSPEKAVVFAAVQTLFPLLFLGAAKVLPWTDDEEPWIPGAAAAVSLCCMAAVFVVLSHGALRERPFVAFAPLLLVDAAVAALVLARREFKPAHLAAGAVVFLGLSFEMSSAAAAAQAPWLYLFVLLFAAGHSFFPVMLQRRDPEASPWHAAYVVTAALFLPLLAPVARQAGSPVLFWGTVGLMNVVALAAAVAAGVLWLVGAAFLVTLLFGFIIATAATPWGGAGAFLLMVVLVAAGFFGAGIWLWRRRSSSDAPVEKDDISAEVLRHLPALSALLPFLLLVTAAHRGGWTDVVGLYGVGFLLAGLCVGLAALRGAGEAVPAALAGLALLQSVWWSAHGSPSAAQAQMSWLTGGLALFFLPPLLLKEKLRDQRAPWLTAAAAGPVYFWLLYQAVHPHLLGPSAIGALPAFMALLYGLGLAEAVKTLPAEAPHRGGVLAAWGGVTLFLASLIFPLQFEKEWITLGWAAEGAALLWLFHRIPHPGLKAWAAGLLVLAFARLALNPAVVSYHPRGGAAVFNWYLYVYGAGAALLFLAARLWRPADEKVQGWNVPSVLQGMGGTALFLLMNIEIADFFSAGPALTFTFSGSLGQDMAYTLGWGLFGLACLVLGLARSRPGVRTAGTALLAVAALKLFLHDIWRLGALYRVTAFVGLAVLLIAASFLYQRFIGKEKRP